MTAIVCIEDRGGILFLKRRCGRDAFVYDDIAKEHEKILLTSYSLPLFEGRNISTRVCLSPLAEGASGDACFIESEEIWDNLKKISRIILYRWNRRYPSDVKLGFEPRDVGFSLRSSSEFVGNAHDKITKEIYER